MLIDLTNELKKNTIKLKKNLKLNKFNDYKHKLLNVMVHSIVSKNKIFKITFQKNNAKLIINKFNYL